MGLDPRTPVLVGAFALSQRAQDPREAREAFELMADALRGAAVDAGTPRLLSQADSIRVPRGFWQYRDPGRLVCAAIGADRARTELAEIGVLQQTLLDDACRAIAAGRERIALVTGGEHKYRELRARIEGVEVRETGQGESVEPDRRLVPGEPLFHRLELERGLMAPVRAFAVMENALRHADGIDLATHRRRIAELWAGLNAVARDNPLAWHREPVSVAELTGEGGRNRMMAFPYGRLHNSDWNVDQAAGLILCSLEVARALGVPEAKWVFPWVGTECNHVVPLSARDALHRSPGAAVAGRRALALAGRSLEQIDLLEIYSCFPAPVQVFVRELGVAPGRTLTVTGGMPFAGGPLNNYVLQATVCMAEHLRGRPASTGLVSSISGFLNKVGYAVWGTEPRAEGFAFEDCTREVAATDAPRPLVDEGAGRVASYTVAYVDESPAEGIAVCELADGARTIGVTRDPQVARRMTESEACGLPARVAADGTLALGPR